MGGGGVTHLVKASYSSYSMQRGDQPFLKGFGRGLDKCQVLKRCTRNGSERVGRGGVTHVVIAGSI